MSLYVVYHPARYRAFLVLSNSLAVDITQLLRESTTKVISQLLMVHFVTRHYLQ